VTNLGKRFRIGGREPYLRLSDMPRRLLSAVTGRLRGDVPKADATILWALKDVSFEVQRGEVVGIIGRNGAGKSTLLKVLSRITRPSEGELQIRGRVGSLLEVGTGFHPELTGRENIYLNGTILGMRKREIDRKFDQIVAFSEIEKFLDTPVKHYSSGMYMRLAFAVAAHLEPEVLLVDEVLAVGDAQFQKKCLGKMRDVAQDGRTILFVSHNMAAIQTLCPRAVLLETGAVADVGRSADVIRAYCLRATGAASREEVWDDDAGGTANGVVRLRRIAVRPTDADGSGPLTMETPFAIEVEHACAVADARIHVTLHICTDQQVVAFTSGSCSDPKWSTMPRPAGIYRSVCHIPGSLLNSGPHYIVVYLVRDGGSVLMRHESSIMLDIREMAPRSIAYYGREPGVVQPKLKWMNELVSELSV
jgi:lipopolysaccharide transport system ATP-binding protein